MTETKGKGRGAAAKVLMPVVATLASAAASYLAKKAPQYLEQTVVPKLREGKDSAGEAAHNLTERAGAAVPGGGDDGDDESTPTTDELERRRRERAEHRAARRKAS
jgi:hypothetical protein